MGVNEVWVSEELRVLSRGRKRRERKGMAMWRKERRGERSKDEEIDEGKVERVCSTLLHLGASINGKG